MRTFDFQRSISVADALAQPGTFLAGGTTLIDLVKLDVMRPARVVDINRLPLSRMERLPDGRFRIGALVRNSDLAWHADIKRDYPVLAEALLSGASAQIRNMATTGGNLLQRVRCPYYRDIRSACNKREPGTGCDALEGYNRMHAVLGVSEACIAAHPSDMCVALAALAADVVVQGPNGERTIALADFHLRPGSTPEKEYALGAEELVTAIILPPPLSGSRQRYLKLRDRESFEFALASAAVIATTNDGVIQDIRVALGGVGTTPWRAREAEEILRGAVPTEDLFRAAAAAAMREARPAKHNAFKIALAQQAIVRALQETTP